ncbi:MAG: 2OG-Fe(II) oxygenase [Alphaproteobacteria bacterium]|nr:2OG-Fe(II) oxygenase [Alphaproteobacteria bacterium]
MPSDLPVPAFGRTEIAGHIAATLARHCDTLTAAFHAPGQIASCYVDDLLPEPIARAISHQFPGTGDMVLKGSLRERKYVSAQMDRHAPLIEEAIYAFQDTRVLRVLKDITGLPELEPDAALYAGGISAMPQGNYLRPHIDNSHDKEQDRYRVMNLLYYVTPDWQPDYGGNLELWDTGPKGEGRVIHSRFNRLVLMATNRNSWHSVSEITHPGVRRCVSNYYFSRTPLDTGDYFHATSFRGRPEESLTDMLLRLDNAVRTTLLRAFGTRLFKNPHVYKRTEMP